MKVVLATLNAKYIHSSLSLAYLKAYCHSDALDIVIKEYSINELTTDILADLHQSSPDVLCFSCYIWNIVPILQICRDFKSINPNIPIILGGPEVSYDAKEVLSNNPIDFVIRGEGERTLKELLSVISTNSTKANLSTIKGISYKTSGVIVENNDRELITSLDEIPFPYNNLEAYYDKTIYYETSRGCPFNCAYCLSSTTKGVRFFSLPRVKRDLKYLVDNNVKEIKFVDRTFNCNEERALEIMNYIIDINEKTKFHFEIGAELISDKFMKFLSKVPKDIFDFEIGIQSTCDKSLRAVTRKSNWDNLKNRIKNLVELGNIHIHLDLIAGLPYENYNRFAQSFNDVFQFKANMLQLGFLKLLKGSSIRHKASLYGYIYQSEPPYQVLANHVMTYDELIKLSQIETLVNKYYNTHIVDETLEYIINYIFFGNAFNFFEDFAMYWDKHNLFYLGHKRDTLYSILIKYISTNFPDHFIITNETLKFDYLKNNKSYSLPDGLHSNPPSDRVTKLTSLLKHDTFVRDNLNSFLGKTVREIKKYTYLEYFTLNPLNNYNSCGWLLFVYTTDKKIANILDVTSYI